MSGLNIRKLALIAGLGMAAWMLCAADAQAFWGRHGSWGSSGGSWGSSGGSSGSWGSSGGSSGSWGSSGGWHRHRRHHGSWGSSGGSSGGSHGSWGSSGGSSGGSHGSWGSSGGSSGGSHGSWGSSGGSSGGSHGYSYGAGYGAAYGEGYEVEGVMDQPMPPTPPAAPAPGAPALDGASTYYPVERDSVLLNVFVPADAKVFVNGAATTSTGTERQFISRGLQQGATYAYELRAEMDRDGRTVTETKQVVVTGGERTNVQFTLNKTDDERMAKQPVRTTLRLQVPADAKVFLSGKEMKTTGEIREFSTTRLAEGNAWADYAVRVELNRDGQTLSKEASVTLAAGESRDLTVDFDAAVVAQR